MLQSGQFQEPSQPVAAYRERVARKVPNMTRSAEHFIPPECLIAAQEAAKRRLEEIDSAQSRQVQPGPETMPTAPMPTAPMPMAPMPTVPMPTAPMPTAPMPMPPMPTAPLPTVPSLVMPVPVAPTLPTAPDMPTETTMPTARTMQAAPTAPPMLIMPEIPSQPIVPPPPPAQSVQPIMPTRPVLPPQTRQETSPCPAAPLPQTGVRSERQRPCPSRQPCADNMRPARRTSPNTCTTRADNDATHIALDHLNKAQQGEQPANSGALQQILQHAQAIFPDRSISPDNAVSVSARPAEGAATVQRTQVDWDKEVNQLLNGDGDGATSVWRRRVDNTYPIDDPFPGQFPGSTWMRVDRPQGQGCYFVGRMCRGDDWYRITAVPGEYRPMPPGYMQSIGRYIPCEGGGCWVRVERE